ncbi:MAG: hypothetical protein WC670_16345 [Pseudolabrys sp.]
MTFKDRGLGWPASGTLGMALGVALLAATVPAGAQENLDQGKTAQQLFASDCAICHKSPQGLAKSGGIFGLQGFLREHYTVSRESAAMLSKYLEAAGEAPPEAAKRSNRAAKPADGKKSDSKPSDGKPSDAKSSDAKSSDAKSSDAKSSDTKSSDTKSSDTKSSEKKPDEAKPESKTAAKPDSTSESKPDNKPEPKAEVKPEAKPESKPESKPDSAAKPEKSE